MLYENILCQISEYPCYSFIVCPHLKNQEYNFISYAKFCSIWEPEFVFTQFAWKLQFMSSYSELEVQQVAPPRCYIVNWKHKICSGAKHIPLFSQRPFRFHCSIGALFHTNRTNTILLWVETKQLILQHFGYSFWILISIITISKIGSNHLTNLQCTLCSLLLISAFISCSLT